MKTEVMKARLRSLSSEQINKALRLIREGNGASSVKFNTGLSLKEVNAVFEFSRQRAEEDADPLNNFNYVGSRHHY